ncbi:metallophosphoesterase family protein [Sulfuracidifex metallicus]|uniref:metallophosphoesterase family protein n=1 Tax=Sulfuracidifex metallicus TaxID=47303 RepID=UPI002272D4A1|nr:metallophosphoesterase [Sulfuracidifex metallicus]MCY0849746.1 metallophosphoesterase [Sulfuracidifex metallicus]
MPLFKRRGNNESVGGENKIKILFTSDLHGSETAFRKFLNVGVMQKVDCLIIGGDIAGKSLVPIVNKGNGYFVIGDREISSSSINNVVAEFRKSGVYYAILSKAEHEELINNKKKLDELFNEKMKENLKGWVEIAQEKLKERRIPVFINLGNDDPSFLFQVIEESELMRKSEGNIIDIGGHEMISFGYVNPTPWRTPREMSEDELMHNLKGMAEKLEKPEKAIFNFHAPPYNTSLDNAPLLSADLKPVVKGGDVVMTHVGSKAIRKIIEEYQPMLGIHGHIHESRAFDKIGRTVIINPGSEFNQGILHSTLILLEDGRVKGNQFIVG